MLSKITCILLVKCLYIKIGLAMSDEEMLNHAHLAAQVKNYYRASSIFNVYRDEISDMTITTKMLRLSLYFSRHDIFVQSMKMSKVYDYAKYYKYRALAPLYIITLKTQLDMIEFTKFANNFEMSLNLWLVFIYNSEDLLRYCTKPDNNAFNVKFDTKMLVKCENDTILKEWYAVRKDQVKVNDLANWSIKEGLVCVNNKTLWQRRNTLDGITLRIASVKDTSLATAELGRKRGTLWGLFGSVLRELTHMANFTAELVAVDDVYGNLQANNGTWSGVLGRLINNQIDIGVGEFGRSNDRLDVIDFTRPLLLTTVNLYLRQPNTSAIAWSTYVHVFDKGIWRCNLVLIIMCSIVVSLMAAKVGKKQTLSAAADNWFYVWGIQCQQAMAEFPTALSLKIAFMSIMITSIVVYTSYSATLTSYLALFIPKLPFTSEHEFLHDTSYNLIAARGSVYHDMVMRATDPRATKMRRRLIEEKDLPNSMMEAIDQVCHDKVVLITNELFVDKMSDKIHCPLVAISLGQLDSVSFTLTKNSPFRGLFNFYIENFRSHGVIKVLMNRHLRKMDPIKINYYPVSFWSVVPLLTIYFSGIGLAIVVLTCEHLFYIVGVAVVSRNRQSRNNLTDIYSARSVRYCIQRVRHIVNKNFCVKEKHSLQTDLSF